MKTGAANIPGGAKESSGEGTNFEVPAIPDHTLLRCIGRGSYGEVWLAHSVVGTWRAVKVVRRATFERAEHFEREFRGIQKFEPISRAHEGFVDILQIGRSDEAGYFYYVMELADDANGQGNARSHPGPLPRGEGETSSARRQAGVHRIGERGPMAVPSPGAADEVSAKEQNPPGQGEGGPTTYIPKTLRAAIRSDPQRSTPNSQAVPTHLPVAESVNIGVTLASALAHLHKNGLVHRDIKPSNIIFVGGVPKLADIGLVAEASEARSFVGTVGFIPPEGPGSPQADLYSLGKVLYEISTGQDRQDFPQLPPDLLRGRAVGTPSPGHPRPSDGGGAGGEGNGSGEGGPNQSLLTSAATNASGAAPLIELNEVLLKACHKDLRQRYASAEAMLAELELLQRGQSVQRKHAAERRFAFARRILAPMLLIAALAAGGWYWFNSMAPRNAQQRQAAVDPARRAEAQKLYEKARTYGRGNKDGIAKATELLSQAILADPNFAPAVAYLAQVKLESAGWHVPPKQALTEAKVNAHRALLLDPSLAQAHLSLAQILFKLNGDWAGAEAEFKRTIELRPTNAGSYVWYGQMLSALGRFDEADAVLKHAQELYPNSQVVLTTIGWRYYKERRFTEALPVAGRARALHPKSPVAHQLYACVQERLKNYPEALTAAQQARQLDSVPDLIALVGFVQARADDRAEAKRTLDELNVIAKSLYVSPIYQAWIYAGLGEVDKVVERLQKAHEELPFHPALLQTEPKWDEVRDDPRFVALLQKMRLEK